MTIEIPAGQVQDYENNSMKEFTHNDQKILVSKVKNEFHAILGVCTHYGAPLSQGLRCGDTVRCPWHCACFSLETGDIEDFPGLDSVPSFDTKVTSDGQVIVLLPDEMPPAKIKPQMKVRKASNNRTVLIIGGGAAGASCAETLRREGFTGRVVIATAEPYLPYDRVKLSKAFLMGKAGESALPLRSEAFYKENDIEVWYNKKVKSFDAESMSVSFEDGTSFQDFNDYQLDFVVLCTGGKAFMLPIPGAKESKNVFTLRSRDDANSILSAAKKTDKRVVVVGGSFIGLEAAASMKAQGKEVTVLSPEKIPFVPIFGETIGKQFLKKHKELGVDLRFGDVPNEFHVSKDDNTVHQVSLKSGETLDNVGLVIIGIGVSPITDFVHGLQKHEKDGSIFVDEFLRAHSKKSIYVAGDIARYPDHRCGKDVRIEHWKVAQQHGQIAALNIIQEKSRSINKEHAPYFWTTQAGVKVEYAGHAEGFDEVFYVGNSDVDNEDKPSCIAFMVKNNEIHAAVGLYGSSKMAHVYEQFRNGGLPNVDDLRSGKITSLENL
eukprot:gb/GECH01012469.1/.p1 GENE.gb/GECH01012469.1/~~gb/GECH01012469.1/.p1  ORF type:complete len:549 (+),score=172.98 gb/GECH01012469.1/:1-1647(+)